MVRLPRRRLRHCSMYLSLHFSCFRAAELLDVLFNISPSAFAFGTGPGAFCPSGVELVAAMLRQITRLVSCAAHAYLSNLIA